jgi:hypothetical protein
MALGVSRRSKQSYLLKLFGLYATKVNIPSTHDITVYIHNKFIGHLIDLKSEIQSIPGRVSSTTDLWSLDQTKVSFLRMTGHWIKVNSSKWMLHSEIIGFHGLSGPHSGENVGRYFLKLCERVGIISSSVSKVC